MPITLVRVPDLGDFGEVPVIEVLVAPGAAVGREEALVTLESDKATMDVPAPHEGLVREIHVQVGDQVSKGALLLSLEAEDPPEAPAEAPGPAQGSGPPAPSRAGGGAGAALGPGALPPAPPGEGAGRRDPAGGGPPRPPAPGEGADAGGNGGPGPLPAAAPGAAGPAGGSGGEAPLPPAAPEQRPLPAPSPPPSFSRASPTALLSGPGARPRATSHATPSLRRFARELGVDLSQVTGTGRKGRILDQDIKGFVKSRLEKPEEGAAGGLSLPPMPAEDFGRFGEVEVRPLSRIKRISGPRLHRAWVRVPHVTHHDEADVTGLEAFRQSLKEQAAGSGVRVTLLAFAIRALARAVLDFPVFNASLSPDGHNLILKRYVNVGVAIDTSEGLVVPVLRGAAGKGLLDLAGELGELGRRAREKRLRSEDFQGGSITVSSLGGIGGTAFTPIVNAPEVAVLGLARAARKARWDGERFAPRLMQPLDLSYDHRVIDGAEAARFARRIAELLEDLRRLLL